MIFDEDFLLFTAILLIPVAMLIVTNYFKPSGTNEFYYEHKDGSIFLDPLEYDEYFNRMEKING